MNIYRENRIQESGVRIQEKNGSCLFSCPGLAPLAMAIYRENSGQSAVKFDLFSSTGVTAPAMTIYRNFCNR
jgi:hypothetical protein